MSNTDLTQLGAKPKAPRVPLKWDHSATAISETTTLAIERSRAIRDKIAALPRSSCTFENVFLELAKEESELENTTGPLTFYQYVSTQDELRNAANTAEQRLNEYGIEASMRIDVFEALKAAKANIDKEELKLAPEENRLVEKLLLDGKRNGLDLPEETRNQVATLKKELSNTCTEFSKNFNEEKGTVTFTKEKLKGVPEDVINGYGKKDDEYVVTFKTPDLMPVLKHAQDPETRKEILQASESKLAINVPLLTKAIDLRRRLAKLMNYKTWADYVEEDKMIKTGKAVEEFLADLRKKLTPIGLKERDELLKIKKEQHERYGYPFDNEFYICYYDNAFIEKFLDLDDNFIKEYFPVEVVVPAILEIYQELLGVKFRVSPEKVGTWHPDVQHFEVWDADATTEKDFLGDVYLDLYPRENKYSHAAVWGLIQGFLKQDGLRQYPVACMVANLAKPTPSRPALMRHDDVVTYFHEMGHVFHGLLSRTTFGRFHGTSVARDFVEAPSQMLENWCWEPSVLRRVSSHYETKQPLPDDLIEKLIKSRYVNIGLFSLRQLFFGTFDIKVHTDTTGEIQDYSKFWCDLREQVSLVKTGDKITPGQGSFGHITGGYDAGYYGYLYSQVFSADMYETVFKKDPMSAESGKRYRHEILLPGGSRDEMDSLKAFLGREPNSDAFLKSILGTPNANPSAANL
ncbi:metallopeptidase MepB [Cantharellus anzutake]|uniref:metallopeptidase MepB n=1 Tax=Cantharellus anzutake TaxID=1750568 RepID=UPI0019051FE9|nr:metallopeptidase MepB [Cantharellus anzutake]KAF8311667.1 metallopeptidase MepB [Cantharellus anzutake]